MKNKCEWEAELVAKFLVVTKIISLSENSCSSWTSTKWWVIKQNMRMRYRDAYLHGIYYRTFCFNLIWRCKCFFLGPIFYWYYWQFIIILWIITIVGYLFHDFHVIWTWYVFHTLQQLKHVFPWLFPKTKKMLQNILIWYFLLFLWCKKFPQKKTFIAMMHSSWWINYHP